MREVGEGLEELRDWREKRDGGRRNKDGGTWMEGGGTGMKGGRRRTLGDGRLAEEGRKNCGVREKWGHRA